MNDNWEERAWAACAWTLLGAVGVMALGELFMKFW